MSGMARIQVQLNTAEWKMLLNVADQECREPRQQARFMLKQLLQRKNEDAALSLATKAASSETINPELKAAGKATLAPERKAASL